MHADIVKHTNMQPLISSSSSIPASSPASSASLHITNICPLHPHHHINPNRSPFIAMMMIVDILTFSADAR
jgi:hypothetical protein